MRFLLRRWFGRCVLCSSRARVDVTIRRDGEWLDVRLCEKHTAAIPDQSIVAIARWDHS